MKLQLTYCTKMDICFDNTYTISQKIGTLENMIKLAEYGLTAHNFHSADIIDSETGEIIAILSKDSYEKPFIQGFSIL